MSEPVVCGCLGCKGDPYAIVDTANGERTVCEDHASENDILVVIA